MKNNSQKKILIIGPFPEPTTGLSLANKVVYDGLSSGFKTKKINTSYIRLDSSIGKPSIYKFWFFIKKNILNLYKLHNVEIVYITIGQTFWGVLKYTLYILFSKLRNKQIIIHLHGNEFYINYCKLNKSRQKIIRFLISKVDKAIVLSTSLRKNFSDFLEEKKIYTLSNFVEDFLFLDTIEKQKKEYNSLKIIYLSNLMEAKGIFHFLDSLEKLEQENIKFEAKCAGIIDISIQEKVKKKISKIKNLEYLGMVSGEDKRELLKWGNTFIFPSYLVEGLPLSILEAMATGNIILSTKHPAIEDYFKKDNLIYIEKESSDSILEKLKNINGQLSSNKAMIDKNYDYIEKNAKVEKFIENMKIIIED